MSKKTVTFENFDPKKVKLVGNTVEVSYYDLESPNRLQEVTGKDLPHPDLIESLGAFNEIMAKALDNMKGWDHAREASRGNDEMLQQSVKGYNERVDQHHVSGVAFIGDEKKGIQISGSVKSELGSTGMAAPKIYFGSDKISFGDEAEEKGEVVKKEIWAYLFKDKVGKAKPKAGDPDPAQTEIPME